MNITSKMDIRYAIMGIRPGIYGRRYMDILPATQAAETQAQEKLERGPGEAEGEG